MKKLIRCNAPSRQTIELTTNGLTTIGRAASWIAIAGALALVACSSDDGSNTMPGDGDADGNMTPPDDDVDPSMSDDDMPDDPMDTPDDELSTGLRVIHASADAPPVDVYVAGTDSPAIEDLAYGESTEFLALPPGRYAFDIRAAGAPASDAPLAKRKGEHAEDHDHSEQEDAKS
jgi:hypothetical protein